MSSHEAHVFFLVYRRSTLYFWWKNLPSCCLVGISSHQATVSIWQTRNTRELKLLNCVIFSFFFFFNKIKPNFIHLLTEIRILKFFLMLQSELEINPTCSQFTIRRTTFVPEPLRTSTGGKMARNRWKKFVDDLLTLVAKSRFGYSCWTTQHPRTGWGSFHQ